MFRQVFWALLACGQGLRLPAAGQSPDFRFERLSIAQGLPAADIRSIAQDRFGFLWFGTEKGLYRHDGYSFTHFRHDPADPTSLGDDETSELLVDRNGVLWIGNPRGLDRFVPERESFQHYAVQDSLLGTRPTPIGRLFEGSDGSIWAGSEGQLVRFDPGSGRFAVQSLGEGSGPVEISDFAQDAEGYLWISSWGKGLFRYDPQTGSSQNFRHDPANPNSLSSDLSMALLFDRRGRLWVGSEDGLNRIEPRTGTVTRLATEPPRRDHVRYFPGSALLEDRKGAIWIGNIVSGSYGSDGLMRLDPEDESILRFSYDPTDPAAFQGNLVLSLFEDRSGIVWVGTMDQGVSKVDAAPAGFTSFRYDPRDPNGLADGVVRAVLEARDGSWWIGTDGGLHRLNPWTGRMTRYRRNVGRAGSLSHNIVRALAEDSFGQLWVGTYGGGLNRLDPQTGRFTRFPHGADEPSALGHAVVEDVRVDRRGMVWVAHMSGLDRFEPAGERFVRQHFASADLTGPLTLASQVLQDAEETLWVRGEYQLPDGSLSPATMFRLDRSSGRFLPAYSLPEGLTDMVETESGQLWAAGMDGLYLFDQKTGRYALQAGSGPLPAVPASLSADLRGGLWIGTRGGGLLRYDPERRILRTFDETDGLPSLDFVSKAATRCSDGSLLLGTSNGLVVVRPELVQSDSTPPPILLTNFELLGQSVRPGEGSPLEQAITLTRSITLRYDQRDVTIGYAALSYRKPERSRYAVLLEEYDTDWREVGTLRSVTYTHLPPGDYLFRVRGSNGDGIWNKEGASLRITILPPWWSTWWFRVLAIAASLGLGVAAYRIRVNQLLRLERERRRIADDLHDDIGAKMSGIAMLVEMAGRGSELAPEERDLLEEATRSARQLVNDVRDTVWLIESAEGTLLDLIDRIGLAAEQLLRLVPHTIRLPDSVPELRMRMGMRRNLMSVVKEALHNAVRHAGASRIELSISFDRETMVVSIRDDGSGFDVGATDAGRGLHTMRGRARELGGSLTVESAPGKGTEVRLAVSLLSGTY